MLKVWMLLFGLISLSAQAASKEFRYIKLDPKFEEYLININQQPNGFLSTKNLKDNQDDQAMESHMRRALLGTTQQQGLKAMAARANAGEEPPLYEEIRTHLENSHNQIGRDEVTRLDNINRQFNLGKDNFSGFSWQKPFGTVNVHADRQVTPNLYTEGAHDQWLVQDTFTFEIEATTYLEELKKAKLAKMSEREIGAFAGITFKRVYTYYHYAPSYQAGLIADFSKLFLSFTRFSPSGIERLADNEIIKREDKFTAKAGGLITTPPIYHVSFSAGMLAEADVEQGTSIQSLHTSDSTAQRYTVGVRRKATRKAGASLQIQVDFFKLLKLTLIRAEMKYEYTAGKEFTLGFTPPQWQHAQSHDAEGEELRSILLGFTEIKALEPYVIRLDETQSQGIEAYGNILLWGRMDKSKHESNRIIKDGVVHVFHKTYMQKTKYVESLISWILSEVFTDFWYNILMLPIGSKNVGVYDKKVIMEYKASHPQAENSNIQRVKTAEDFSFKLSRSYEAASTHRSIDSKYKNDVVWFIGEFTSLPKNYQTDIKSNKLKGPIRVDSHLRVEQAGFKHFMLQTPKQIFGVLVKVCKSGNLKAWQDDVERIRMMAASQSGADACVKSIGREYLSYMDDYEAYYKMPSLTKFRLFLMEYVNACENIAEISSLFGSENTFLSGELTARLPNGAHFRDVFSRGQFRGHGVIDNFKRLNGTRTPASITND